MVLYTKIWYSQSVGIASQTLIKEELMPEPRTCHLPHITALFCIGLVEALQRQAADIVVPGMTELGGR